MRGATEWFEIICQKIRISIHTPHAGSDTVSVSGEYQGFYFNPHSPCGERHTTCPICSGDTNFNPHSPCGERRAMTRRIWLIFPISIHTPHAGSDVFYRRWRIPPADFNPHSPCGERLEENGVRTLEDVFQSTLPMRGATVTKTKYFEELVFQSTLPMRGATGTLVI